MRLDYVLVILLVGFIVSLAVIDYSLKRPEQIDVKKDKPTTTTLKIIGEKMSSIVVLQTTKGDIVIELDGVHAPVTVNNFVNYVRKGHYDGTVFHRVISTFMIQGGGFTIERVEKPTDPPIKLESQSGLTNLRGTIAMARTMDPNSATSQFFINVVDNNNLDYSLGNPGYAVFGKVIEGMDVVDQIKSVKTTTKDRYNDWPVEDIVIEKAYVKG